MNTFIYYLIIINFVSIIICYIDKKKSIYHRYRISESFLFFISIIGGCFGFIIGMYIFHHKTKKLTFKFIIPILCIIWIYLIGEVLL